MQYLHSTPYGSEFREKTESDRIISPESLSIRTVHDTIHNAFLMNAYHEKRVHNPVTLKALLEKHGEFSGIATNVYKADLSSGNAENHKILFKSNNLLIPNVDQGWEEASFAALVRWKNSEPLQMRILLNAVQRNKPVLFVETGFFAGYASWAEKHLHPYLRRPLGFIIDDLTFYFDATRPSRLELTLNRREYPISNSETARARGLIDRIVTSRFTKYNILTEAEPEISWESNRPSDFVLVVDQGVGDASIELGLASKASFSMMLKAAIAENPGKTILVKVHPDTLAAGRNGNFGTSASAGNVVFLTKPVSPHVILDKVERVYVVSSQLGFEALLRGKEVVCFGVPFYAGWGLTDDRVEVPRRAHKRTIEEVFHAACIDFTTYIDPTTGEWCTMERCLDLIENLRQNPGEDLAPPVRSEVNINAQIKRMREHTIFVSLISGFYGEQSNKRMKEDPEKFYESAKHPLVRRVGQKIVTRAVVRARREAEAKTPPPLAVE
jgi:capsular polysaccharide export protein